MDCVEEDIWFMNSKEYYEFISKFEERHTTDDCYTPPAIYDVVADWVAKEYNLNPDNFVRPFVPNGNYQAFEYAPDAVVVDNPPFSKLAEIQKFYAKKGIGFFLFSPALTVFKPWFCEFGICAVCANAQVIYDNGAIVNTSFVTNLEKRGHMAVSAPELRKRIDAANDKSKKTVPRYEYPPNVLSAAMINAFSKHGVDYKLDYTDCSFIRALDAQKRHKKTIYGGGLLLSEKAAAEKAAVIAWELSDGEREIIAGLGR